MDTKRPLGTWRDNIGLDAVKENIFIMYLHTDEFRLHHTSSLFTTSTSGIFSCFLNKTQKFLLANQTNKYTDSMMWDIHNYKKLLNIYNYQ